MEAETTAQVARLCSTGAATVVATADDAGRAAITRGWGIGISPAGLVTLCVSASASSPTHANLAANGRIAVTLVDPTTYAAMQVKGIAEIVREPNDAERELDDERVAVSNQFLSKTTRNLQTNPRLTVRVRKPMNVVIVHHTVADYETWKSGYDAHEAARRAAGCTSSTVTRAPAAADGATEVTIAMEFPKADAAKGFLDDPGLAEAMKAAGVVGIPDIRITELVESTTC